MIPTKILPKYMKFDLYVKYGSEESEKNPTVGDGDVDLNDDKRLKLLELGLFFENMIELWQNFVISFQFCF